jgi:hypothetical protein
MKSQLDWIQIMTAAAVILGVGLVVYELRQTKDLVEAQLSVDSYVASFEADSMVLGENFSETLARINTAGSILTDAELYEYDSWAFSRITLLRMQLRLTNRGFFNLRVTELVDPATACWFFGHDVGQAYLTSPAVVRDEIVDRLRELSKDCSNVETYIEHMRKKLPTERTSGA